MANNLEERLNALKEKQDYVGDQFGSDDIRTLVEGIEYAMSHGGTVGVTVTALEDGYKITITDSEGVAHEATLKNGAPGADAVNSFKGYYPSGVSKPATGAVGDYLYAPPSDSQSTATATIWYYDSQQTPPWTDTGIDVSAVVGVEFGSGQSVPATKIKDENGEEVTGIADVLSAEAGEMLKEGIDSVYKVEEVVSETETVVFNNGCAASFDDIELSQDGDYLEVDVQLVNGHGYTFKEGCGFMSYVSTDREAAIAIVPYYIGIKNASATWLNGMNGSSGQLNITKDGVLTTRGKVKIVFENSNINIYLRGELIHTVTAQSTIKINRMGKYSSEYWLGTIYSFEYHHGNTTITKLSALPNFQYNEGIVIDPDPTQHEYVESGKLADLKNRVGVLEERVVEHPVQYTPMEKTIEDTIVNTTFGEGYISGAYFTDTGLTYYEMYDVYWLIADKDMKVWVTDKGDSSTFFRLLAANGTIQSYTSIRYSSNPPTTEDNAFEVAEGNLVAISVRHGKTNFRLASKYTKQAKVVSGYEIDDVETLKERVDAVENVVGLPLRIEKTGEKSFSIYSTNKQGATLRYTWYRNQYTLPIGENGSDILCCDVWNQEQIKTATGSNIIQGNSNFIFSVDGANSGIEGDHTPFNNESKGFHIGPGHGCEVAEYTLFLADGKEINPTELTEPLYCSVFKVIFASNCYAVDSTHATGNENNYPKIDGNYNPVIAAKHYIEWELSEDNEIHEYNRLIVKRDGTVFGALYAAMLQCYVPYFKDIIINDDEGSWVEVNSPIEGENYIQHSPKYGNDFVWHVKKAYRVTAVSNNHNVSVTQTMQPLNQDRLDKLNIYTAPYNDRFKSYFQAAETSLIAGSNFETFNSGDKFELLVSRKIGISKDE